MTTLHEPRAAARFLNTLRVATHAALAHEFLRRESRTTGSATTFHALAAKSSAEWRFPAEGLTSANGLLRVTTTRRGDVVVALDLQALGASGLAAFAGRAVRTRARRGFDRKGVFDGDGRLSLPVDPAVVEADLAQLDIDFAEDRA